MRRPILVELKREIRIARSKLRMGNADHLIDEVHEFLVSECLLHALCPSLRRHGPQLFGHSCGAERGLS